MKPVIKTESIKNGLTFARKPEQIIVDAMDKLKVDRLLRETPMLAIRSQLAGNRHFVEHIDFITVKGEMLAGNTTFLTKLTAKVVINVPDRKIKARGVLTYTCERKPGGKFKAELKVRPETTEKYA